MDRLVMEPMTDAELATYLQGSLEAYVRQRVELGGEEPRQARQVAGAQLAEYFPGGAPAEGHVLFTGRDGGTGATVGLLWLHTRPAGAGTTVWIFDVEVEEDRRGQGWGRELMTYAERWAREHGATGIGLNVFGGNTVARRLYASMGYDERSVTMGRRLSP